MGEDLNLEKKPKIIDPVAIEEPVNMYAKIRGWLIVVGFGLCISLPINSNTLRELINLTSYQGWSLLTNVTSKYYQPGIKEIVYFQIIGISIAIIINIIALFYFFKKKKLFPKIIISYFVFSLIFQIIGYVMTLSNQYLKTNSTQSTTNPLVSIFISTAIWVPYFIISERVKKTFVK